MSDLINLVKKERLSSSRQKFWGIYEGLNNPTGGDMSNQALHALQVAKLKILEKEDDSFEATNLFLKNLKNNQYQIENLENEILELSENQIYERIMAIINSGLSSSPLNPRTKGLKRDSRGKIMGEYKEGYDPSNQKNEIDMLIQELDFLLKLIKYNESDSEMLKIALRQGIRGNWSKKMPFESYAQFKANEAEKLMVHALSSQSSGWRALQSGQFYHKGQQLLEDAFVFSNINFNLKFDSGLGFSVKQTGGKEIMKGNVTSLQDFFKLYDSLNGNFSIHLSDELYEKLKELSIIQAQAKSGQALQTLLNETKHRNSISLNNLGPTADLVNLYTLYQLNWLDSSQSSKTLDAITNYCLSRGIALTNIIGNKVYFTRDGFITASKWMTLYRQMLKFNPSLNKVTNNFLSTNNSYVFTSV